MIPKWLEGKQIDELPDIETIKDIFVELEDTKKYDIQYLPFNYDSKRPDINFNEFYYANSYHVKPNYDIQCAYDTDDWLQRMTGNISVMQVVEKKYRIRRLKWRFVIDRLRYKMNEGDDELKEVILRLKDYLGENIEDVHKLRAVDNQIIIDTMLYEFEEI